MSRVMSAFYYITWIEGLLGLREASKHYTLYLYKHTLHLQLSCSLYSLHTCSMTRQPKHLTAAAAARNLVVMTTYAAAVSNERRRAKSDAHLKHSKISQSKPPTSPSQSPPSTPSTVSTRHQRSVEVACRHKYNYCLSAHTDNDK